MEFPVHAAAFRATAARWAQHGPEGAGSEGAGRGKQAMGGKVIFMWPCIFRYGFSIQNKQGGMK
jgi:hypothetical protein